MAKNWLNWEFETDREMLVSCIGFSFGPNPEDRLDEIRTSRGWHGKAIAKCLALTADDVVLDIGSGCGFVGRVIAPCVRHLHCVDISPDFLRYCQRELSEFNNVTCQLIKYADYGPVKNSGITKVYSSAVWIHFNYYDFYHNLLALRDVLKPGGEIYLDYADPEGISDGDRRIFDSHASSYLKGRESVFVLVNYNGFSAVKAVLESTGFELLERKQIQAEAYYVRAKMI